MKVCEIFHFFTDSLSKESNLQIKKNAKLDQITNRQGSYIENSTKELSRCHKP